MRFAVTTQMHRWSFIYIPDHNNGLHLNVVGYFQNKQIKDLFVSVLVIERNAQVGLMESADKGILV